MKKKTKPAPPLKQVFWILQIDHREGSSASIHSTRDLAERALERWVREWWSVEFERNTEDDVAEPEIIGEGAIAEYFKRAGEYWNIEQITLDE